MLKKIFKTGAVMLSGIIIFLAIFYLAKADDEGEEGNIVKDENRNGIVDEFEQNNVGQ